LQRNHLLSLILQFFIYFLLNYVKPTLIVGFMQKQSKLKDSGPADKAEFQAIPIAF